jgi:acetylornithine deacetylase/succinyl-diaminopimelate desuccinylase-like protein
VTGRVRCAVVLAAAVLTPVASRDAGAQQRAGAGAAEAVQAVRQYVQSSGHLVLEELFGLLAIPNVAADSINIQRNARLLVQMLERRGAVARILEGDGPPAVYAELRSPGARRTVVFYAHYDGQPVVPQDWATEPWNPTLRSGTLADGAPVVEIPQGRAPDEWRVYARSASDDKSPIVAMLAALDALRAARITPAVNVKFFFEGEEEAGSRHLRQTFERHRELLAGDLWIVGDGPVHTSGLPQVIFGARGVVGLELTAYGPTRPLHSGHYGNWAPNPAALIIELLASMRTAEGEVKIAGFYDDVRQPTPAELAAADSLARFDDALRRELGLARTEADNAPLPRRLMLPALNIRGLRAGGVGASASNAIFPEAHASIDIRMVPAQRVEHIRAVVERHIREQGFTIFHSPPEPEERAGAVRPIHVRWDAGYPAMRTDMAHPLSRRVIEVVKEATGRETLVLPSYGGSLPLYLVQEVLRSPLVIVPMVNADNNQHAANENLRVGNLWMGMEIYAALATGLGTD